MAQTAIQSVNVPLEISTDNGVTWKSLICVEGYTLTNTSPTTDSDTQCGRFVGIGIEGAEIQGTGVVAMFPTASQLDYTDITTFQLNITQIKYRIQWPTTGSIGGFLYQTGQALFSVTSIVNSTGKVITFAFTLKGVGVRNIVVGT